MATLINVSETHLRHLELIAYRHQRFKDLFSSIPIECWIDQATAFTCREAETIAELLRLSDVLEEDVEMFLSCHAVDDAEGDLHYEEHQSIDELE